MFNGCCGQRNESESSNEKTKSSTRERKNAKNKKNTKHTGEQHFDDINNIQKPRAGSETPSLDPRIRLMEPKTLKLLADLGELKEAHHETINKAEMQSDLAKHADILARLENPTAFQ